ncbi:hypothetical protein N7539_005369 [Penicillium diatomitis]|uniref:MOSC domain-containing protein n=1 Tax=Penicillium diatomitis TaxID=2819901 RepID=A0A9W9X764_9EURO|nr:uncharacterized protein N7539_005369 [Penicillium diatomitis]KAJ5485381.1 hypothetical protein N7539_005369 [Penicillium diatomitis]
MRISELYIYPIKSLRPVRVTEGLLTDLGFTYDRRFMLLKVTPDGNGGPSKMENMHISEFPQMALFHTTLEMSESFAGSNKVVVTYWPPSQEDLTLTSAEGNQLDHQDKTVPSTSHASGTDRLEIQLVPDFLHLNPITVTMHKSSTTASDMGEKYNSWFSDRFGFPVVLAYLGPSTRNVLGNLTPTYPIRTSRWSEILGMSAIKSFNIPGHPLFRRLTAFVLCLLCWSSLPLDTKGLSIMASISINVVGVIVMWIGMSIFLTILMNRHKAQIGFADCAPLLVISQTSVDDASSRVAEGPKVDLTKFRANVVISGAKEAYEEDFWAELSVGEDNPGKVRLLLTGNCVRCRSLNVDFDKGKFTNKGNGNLFKRLMKDRRVDRGARFSPVFGRYAFPERGAVGWTIRVGDEVRVLKTNTERTVTDWPGLAY